MRSIPAALQTHLSGRVMTTCLCWKVSRPDAVVYGFTDHDKDVTVAGQLYEASTSFSATAMQEQLGLAVSNLEVLGLLNSSRITELDLLSGRYDGAVVTILLANWVDPTQFVILMQGTLGKVSIGDISFQAEIRSPSQAFSQYICSLISPRCRVVTFAGGGSGVEAGCQADITGQTRTGTIASVTDRKTFAINAIGGMPADGTGGSKLSGYYASGTIKFTSGNNAGLAKEISTQTGGVNFVLNEPFAMDIQVGDAFELRPGCDRTLPVCRDNWNQIVNRRAEDYVPGTDQVFKINGEGG